MSAHPDNPFHVGFSPKEVRREKFRPKIDSQAKGKRAERDLAAWWREHGFPDASRAVKTGDRFRNDGGDLVLEYNGFRLVVEVKHRAGGLTELQVQQYGNKLLTQVVQSRGTMGVLIERRDKVADPGRWWAHLNAGDFAALYLGEPIVSDHRLVFVPVRCSVAYLAELLMINGYSHPTEE